MPPEPESWPRRHLLIVGLFGFGLYMALGALAFRLLTDPFFATSYWGTRAGDVSSEAWTYIVIFDLYFFIMIGMGLSVYHYDPTRAGRWLILFLMLGPGISVIFTLQMVYLVPFIRGMLAMAPALAVVHIIDRMEETTSYPDGTRPLPERPLVLHLIGAGALIIIFELSVSYRSLLGGVVVWAGALVLALLFLWQVTAIHRKMMKEATMLDDQGMIESRVRVWGRFKAACAVVFVMMMMMPLYTLVMEPGAEIGDESARMSSGDVIIELIVANRYARPIEGKIQVFADIGASTYLVDERNGLYGFSIWKTGTSIHGAGSGGMTCHLRVVVSGRETGSKDTVIQSECDVIWVLLAACAISAGMRRKAGAP